MSLAYKNTGKKIADRDIIVYKNMKRSLPDRKKFWWTSECWETPNKHMAVGNPQRGYVMHPLPFDSDNPYLTDNIDCHIIHAYSNPETAKRFLRYDMMTPRYPFGICDIVTDIPDFDMVRVWVMKIPKGTEYYKERDFFDYSFDEIGATKMTLVRKLTSLEELDEIINEFKKTQHNDKTGTDDRGNGQPRFTRN